MSIPAVSACSTAAMEAAQALLHCWLVDYRSHFLTRPSSAAAAEAASCLQPQQPGSVVEMLELVIQYSSVRSAAGAR